MIRRIANANRGTGVPISFSMLRGLGYIESGRRYLMQKAIPFSQSVALAQVRSESSFLEASGRTLVVTTEKAGETLEIRAPNGAIELVVRLTPEGPVLQLRSSRLELVATGEVQVTCSRFSVEASEDVHIHAAGDLVESAGGRAVLAAAGPALIEARSVELGARLGNIALRANDEVIVEGERIHLNP
jgi:hypothetical protein